MAIVMVAMLAFGGTYAYFTASANTVSSSVKTATIKLNKNSVATISTIAVSGTEIVTDKVVVSLNNETNTDTWVFVEFGLKVKDSTGTEVDSSKNKTGSATTDAQLGAEEFALVYTMTTLGNGGTDGKWAQVGKTATGSIVYGIQVTYTPAVMEGEQVKTPASLSAIPDVCSKVTFIANTNSVVDATGSYQGGTLMNATIEVTLSSKAIQVVGNADLATAAANLGYSFVTGE